jgi:AIR carboxylase
MDAEPLGSVLVGVVMGSRNDYAVMRATVEVLTEFGVAHEVRVVSAHRTPDLLFEYAGGAAGRGLRVIIAGAGGARGADTGDGAAGVGLVAEYCADAEGSSCGNAGHWRIWRDERRFAGCCDARDYRCFVAE